MTYPIFGQVFVLYWLHNKLLLEVMMTIIIIVVVVVVIVIVIIIIIIIKSPQSGVTLCFQFVSAAAAAAAPVAAMTFASHVKTVWASPYIFGTKKV